MLELFGQGFVETPTHLEHFRQTGNRGAAIMNSIQNMFFFLHEPMLNYCTNPQ